MVWQLGLQVSCNIVPSKIVFRNFVLRNIDLRGIASAPFYQPVDVTALERPPTLDRP